MHGSPERHTPYMTAFCALFLLQFLSTAPALAEDAAYYTGSLSCRPCHREQYDNFRQYAKKSRSYRSIEKMQKGLSGEDLKECYACHTTGYGKPGGFISPEKTPHLKNAGCEVCHGPGSRHLETRKAEHIKSRLSIADCRGCHTSERVKAFRYKPLIHGGGH